MFTKKGFILICLAALLVGVFADVGTTVENPIKETNDVAEEIIVKETTEEISEETTETTSEVETDGQIEGSTETPAIASLRDSIVAALNFLNSKKSDT